MGSSKVLAFAAQREDYLFSFHNTLWSGIYQHDPYEHFFVHDPKRRYISEASVKDRVAHQAVVQIIEPLFERGFFLTLMHRGVARVFMRLLRGWKIFCVKRAGIIIGQFMFLNVTLRNFLHR